MTGSALPAWLRESLRCPVTGGELVDDLDEQGRPQLVSPGAALAYPVRNGVPILLAGQARPLSGADSAGPRP